MLLWLSMHWLDFVFKLTAEVSEEASTQYLHITEAGEDVQGTQAAVAALQNLRYTSENGKLPVWGLEYQISFFMNISFFSVYWVIRDILWNC